MAKKHKPEEIVARLRQVDVLTSQGTPIVDAVRSIGVTEVTYYRWRKEYGGLKSDQVKRLKDFETENARLRKAISDLTHDAALSQHRSTQRKTPQGRDDEERLTAGWFIAALLDEALSGAASLFDGSASNTGNETIKEEVIGDRNRDAGDQGASHDLAPVENVAAYEVGRHAQRDRLLV